MRIRHVLPCLALGLLMGLAVPARAQNEGQADLDQATEAKLTAENLDDLGEVVTLTERALDKGLDDSNTAFAKELLAATLLQRATVYSQQIFDRNPPNQQWPRWRQMAVADLERAIESQAELEMAHRLLGRLLMLPGGDRERARKALDESIRLSGEDPLAKAKALALRAKLREKPEEVLSDLNEAVQLAPHDLEVLNARGQAFLTQGKLAEALHDFERALELDPEDADALNALGMALTLDRKFDEALVQFNKLVELAPESPVARLQRSRVYAAQKQWDQALADVNEALRLEPKLPAALLVRAGIHQEQGHRDLALADLEQIIEQRPGAADALLLHAQLAAGGGQWTKAIADFAKLRQLAPESMEIGVQLARFYTAAKQPRKAIALYDELLSKDPKNWQALRGRADAYLNVGQHAEAIADYEAAVKIKPDDQEMLNNFAWVLATSPDDKLRDGKRSIELATKAAELSKFEAAHVLSTLAAGYAETGDFARAREWSQKAVEAGKAEGRLEEQLTKELESYVKSQPWRERQEIEEAEAPVDDPSVAEAPAAEEPAASPVDEAPQERAAPPGEDAPRAEGEPGDDAPDAPPPATDEEAEDEPAEPADEQESPPDRG